MINSKIYLVSKKGTHDANKIHYVNANSRKQALKTAKKIWDYIDHAEDVSISHFSEEIKSGNIPNYVIVAENKLGCKREAKLLK